MSLPMYFPDAPFDLAEARECGVLVQYAYDMYQKWLDDGKPDMEDFEWNPTLPGYTFSQPIAGKSGLFAENKILGAIDDFFKMKVFSHLEPFAFVAWDSKHRAILACRGTESIPDWGSNLVAGHVPYAVVEGENYGEVHDGFYEIYESMSADVIQAFKQGPMSREIFISGHSLGGALATLAVPDVQINSGLDVPIKSYTFASPRVGSPQFAETYNTNGVPTYRFANSDDLVPEVPPSLLGKHDFAHVGWEVGFTSQYHEIARNHNHKGSYLYAIDHPHQPFNFANLPDDFKGAADD